MDFFDVEDSKMGSPPLPHQKNYMDQHHRIIDEVGDEVGLLGAA